jgi:hypothetical protein
MSVSDKLTEAFKALRKQGYFARKNFWCCQSCAWSAMTEEQAVKAVFYHQQDARNLRDENGCYLAWSGDANEIVKTLQQHGLNVEWSGDAQARIWVENNPQF